MPTYEYRCGACGHPFEVFQKISEPPIRTCPRCGEDAVERLISAGGGLVFKGSGFYATDYRKDGPARDRDSGGDGKASEGAEPGGSEKKEKGEKNKKRTSASDSSSGGDGGE